MNETFFEKAEKENLYFYSHNKKLWLSPEEFKEHNEKGRFSCVDDWELVSPNERTKQLKAKIIATKKKLKKWEEQIEKAEIKGLREFDDD